jgi:acetyl/propionyl-CoA carboxylase alpha subunit/acetyl-CoA carboxylase carboxyltransferase component
MTIKRLLIANRGEIAIRIARAAADLAIETVAIHPADDAASLHLTAADRAVLLPGAGAGAYLDIAAVVAAAANAGCNAVHPGYGFLSESAAFARACRAAGLIFVGPSPEALELFGDKVQARDLARRQRIPTIPGTEGPADAAGLKAFFAALPPGRAMLIKAAAGGGGRGMRIVRAADEIDAAAASAAREAEAAFGDPALYAEAFLEQARHVEVQVAGDRTGVLAVGDRDCSLQRRHQKVLEIGPAPNLSESLRRRLHEAAVNLAAAARLTTLATIEFLVDPAGEDFAFIEANARLQVEHTVTEAVTGVDLVQAQIRLAAGEGLAEIGLKATPRVRAFAIQARVNLETLTRDGQALPGGGRITAYEPPSGPGVRVDGYGYAGYVTHPGFDPLLAKVIVSGPTLEAAARRCDRALSEFRLEGVESNIGVLRALLAEPRVVAGEATTRFIDEHAARLIDVGASLPGRKPAAEAAHAPQIVHETVEGAEPVVAGLQATVGSIEVAEGDLVRPGQPVAILEAMKMEHVVAAETGGRVVRIAAAKGEVLGKGQPILFVAPEEVGDAEVEADETADLDYIRPDLAEVLARWDEIMDPARPEAVARRRSRNQRTARENIDDLIDPGTFIEYGAFTLAAQRRRHPVETLRKISPADGLVVGVGEVNGDLFGPEKARCAALAYDFTVLAGTQGTMNHHKTDRIVEVVEREELPLVWFAEGGGGRPGDTDGLGASGLGVTSFRAFAKLAGKVPKIAVVSGRCFAGNAAFAGLCEILICTRNSNIGMGGPAMIEGGGLGVYKPEDIGPMSLQTANGVVDILAEDEADGTRLAKQTLSYFQGSLPSWRAADQRLLRRAIPENRLRVYDVRKVIETLVDEGSFLELRPEFAPGLITGFIRIEGRPMGLIANDPRHLGGAVDCDGADKGSRMLQLCEAFDLPVLSLVDTPGFMVGPDSEAQAAVRKTSRLFINASTIGVPLFSVVLRKAYGLGAQAMMGGHTLAGTFIAAWPTGEFGGMGLEGAVRLGYKKELEAIADPVERDALFNKLLGNLYRVGKATHVAEMLEIDAVIDPADTRRWLVQGLKASRTRHKPSRRWVDAW